MIHSGISKKLAYIPPPTFRDAATGIMMTGVDPLPLVTPLNIFAARRQTFDVIVRRTWSAPRAVDAIFEALPLAENGWDRANVSATHIGNELGLFPIWRLARL